MNHSVVGVMKSITLCRIHLVATCISVAYSKKKENKIEIVELSEHALNIVVLEQSNAVV